MSKKRRKKKQDDHIDESWLIPYADLLTLLLALFIVLFAMSSIDSTKFKALANSFYNEFQGGTGLLDYTSPVEPPTQDTVGDVKADKNKNQPSATPSPTKAPTKKNNESAADAEKKRQIAELKKNVDGYIQSKNLTGKLKTTITQDGLLITIFNDILFDSGSATVRSPYRKVTTDLAGLLVNSNPKTITITGHTDNVPIRNSRFQSNWDLSVMRSVNFMKILLDNPRLSPKLFSVKGYGEYKPVAPNTSAEGRKKNRRVEVLVEPKVTVPSNR
ncbi:flagellar motor protein MotB [Priestia koreensis]|uniref:flagellar motor protein MotB n=1 Tax=Priestia koreensis TaxID=284581 RepID=UPI001F567361|nr:flagellar motor protein MotB [Priestia koreensis]MCM3002573.1 flagellar motor protein MotB [Priestia koreensis]UNL84280.1 flagellar motor protein MotB [Priestia koreensis]